MSISTTAGFPQIAPTAALLLIGSALALPCSSRAAVTNTSTQAYTDLENGLLDPFAVNLTNSPNYVQVVQPGGAVGAANGIRAAKFFWTESGYNGTRSYRGAEVNNSLSFTKEGWQAYSLYVPSSAYPTDKKATISQIFCQGGNYNGGTWASMLEIRNNDLYIEHRGNAASPPDHSATVMANLPRDQWLRIVIHFVASHANKGKVQVWVNGTSVNQPTYSSTNINFGFGDWDAATDSLIADQDPDDTIGLKMGMYNWDEGNYTTNETRTLYYDAMSQLVGGGDAGFAVVNAIPEPAAITTLAVAGVGLLSRRRK